MTNTTNNPNESRKLDDNELGEVSGGYWDYEEEQNFLARWQKLKDDGVSDLPPYEEWITNELNEYDAWAIGDRQSWISAGCPTNRAYAHHGGRR